MKTRDVTRRGFLSGLAGAGLTTPVLGRSATVGVQPDASNSPLVVTSKTNRFVREEITTTAYDLMLNGGSAMDAAEKGTNISESDPRDTTVGYGGDPNEDGFLQLDASVMNGADNNNIGAVAAIDRVTRSSSISYLCCSMHFKACDAYKVPPNSYIDAHVAGVMRDVPPSPCPPLLRVWRTSLYIRGIAVRVQDDLQRC